MTPRERKLAATVGVLTAVFVFGVGGYLGVLQPLSDSKRRADALELEVADRNLKLLTIHKNKPRLDTALKRSLPADPDVARSEYDAAINRLLQQAKVPATAYSVRPKPVDNRSAPEIAAKRPAYTKVAFEVTLKPIDHATLIDVLQRYYRLNLLQQITRFTVKRMEGGASARRGGFSRSSTLLSDRADLDVTFVTEAIILDGAENRRTLLPMPPGLLALAGGAPNALPEPARGMPPPQLAQVLSAADRDYTLMLVKDIFHGPPIVVPPPPPPPEVTKEDTSPFIRLTGVGRNLDGTGTAFIEDIASKQEYAVELTRKAGKLTAQVTKFYYTLKGTKKAYEPDNVLDISEASSGTSRQFKVVGLDGDALILSEVGGGKAAPKEPGKEFGKDFKMPPGGFKKPVPTKVPAAAAVVGGPALTAPPERIVAWKHGEPLSQVKELSAGDAAKAIQRATADPTPPAVPATTPTVPTSAPPPRDVNAIDPGKAVAGPGR